MKVDLETRKYINDKYRIKINGIHSSSRLMLTEAWMSKSETASASNFEGLIGSAITTNSYTGLITSHHAVYEVVINSIVPPIPFLSLREF